MANINNSTPDSSEWSGYMAEFTDIAGFNYYDGFTLPNPQEGGKRKQKKTRRLKKKAFSKTRRVKYANTNSRR